MRRPIVDDCFTGDKISVRAVMIVYNWKMIIKLSSRDPCSLPRVQVSKN
jgi:hypothetical protein